MRLFISRYLIVVFVTIAPWKRVQWPPLYFFIIFLTCYDSVYQFFFLFFFENRCQVFLLVNHLNLLFSLPSYRTPRSISSSGRGSNARWGCLAFDKKHSGKQSSPRWKYLACNLGLCRTGRFPMIASKFTWSSRLPIVRIEINSIQAIEVVSVVRVVCDRLGSVSLWSSRSSEHFLRRLGRSGRSYGNQA